MSKTRNRLTAADIQGAWAIMPTPAKPGASDWRAESTVDLDETARAVDGLIEAGVDGIITLGTFGECAALTWEEKRDFMATAVETVNGRVPFFAGTTSLNTRETVRQTQAALDIGCEGTMLGLPMWCKADVPTAVQFYRDVAEAVPDMAICIYANLEAFKFEFPRPFWAQVATIPQVVSAKYLNVAQLFTDLKLTKGNIRFLTTEGDFFPAARIDPEQCTAFWTSGVVCGPKVSLELRDRVRQAVASGDWSAAKKVAEDIKAANSTLLPQGNFAEFSKYNVGLEKARINAAGWMRAGPPRAPYHIIPETYIADAQKAGRAWAALEHELSQRDDARGTMVAAK